MAKVAAHLEDFNEATREETVWATDNQSRERCLAVRRSGRPNKWTQGNGGSRQKLAAAWGQLTLRAIPAQRMGHGSQGASRDNVAKEAPKGRTLERRRRTRGECSNGIIDRDLTEQLRLRKEGDLQEDHRAGDRKANSRVFNLAAESDWTLRRDRPPPKRKKRRTKHSTRKRTNMMVVHLDQLAPYQGAAGTVG
jgi:hypothetical protein